MLIFDSLTIAGIAISLVLMIGMVMVANGKS